MSQTYFSIIQHQKQHDTPFSIHDLANRELFKLFYSHSGRASCYRKGTGVSLSPSKVTAGVLSIYLSREICVSRDTKGKGGELPPFFPSHTRLVQPSNAAVMEKEGKGGTAWKEPWAEGDSI